jgi:hypothetical protein
MNRDSGVARTATRALLTGALVLALGASAAALAQAPAPADDTRVTSATGAAPEADQPRRARHRRRPARPVGDTCTPAGAATLPTYTATTTSAQLAETVEATMVCKNIKVTGTKISRRLCGTPEQWASQERKTTDDAQEAMRQVRERSSIVVTQPGQQAPTGLGGAN